MVLFRVFVLSSWYPIALPTSLERELTSEFITEFDRAPDLLATNPFFSLREVKILQPLSPYFPPSVSYKESRKLAVGRVFRGTH